MAVWNAVTVGVTELWVHIERRECNDAITPIDAYGIQDPLHLDRSLNFSAGRASRYTGTYTLKNSKARDNQDRYSCDNLHELSFKRNNASFLNGLIAHGSHSPD